jgi:hypothetical protein
MKLASVRFLVSALTLIAAKAEFSSAPVPGPSFAALPAPHATWGPPSAPSPPSLRHAQAVQLLERVRVDTERLRGHLRAMRGLAWASAGGQLTAAERAQLQVQYRGHMERIAQIAATSNYDGIALLDGTYWFVALQLRPARHELRKLKLNEFSPYGLGLVPSNVSSMQGAAMALATCDGAYELVTTALRRRHETALALEL